MSFNDPKEMSMLSNKHVAIANLFDHMNFKKDTMGNSLNTIDTFEILATIILAIDGDPESMVRNIIYVFGFENGTLDETISKAEFQFFLDSLFRGMMALIIPPE